MNQLDQHTRNILRFLERYLNRFGGSPSFEEIRKGARMNSKDHVSRDLGELERLGYVRIKRGKSRSIILLRTADGYPVTAGEYRIPLWGIITAGAPIPLPDANAQPLNWIEVTRAMLHDSEDVFALYVRGDSMIDALVNDGDVVILRKQETAKHGEMIAARLKTDPTNPVTTLKRIHYENDQIVLKPENPMFAPISVRPDDIEIQATVLCVMRNTARDGTTNPLRVQ
jgi:repressor LexA